MMAYLHGGELGNEFDNRSRALAHQSMLKVLGIEDQYIVEALLHAKNVRLSVTPSLGRGLTRKAAEELARFTLVIE